MSDVEGDDVPVAAAAPVSTGPMDINTAIQVEDITALQYSLKCILNG